MKCTQVNLRIGNAPVKERTVFAVKEVKFKARQFKRTSRIAAFSPKVSAERKVGGQGTDTGEFTTIGIRQIGRRAYSLGDERLKRSF